MHRNSEVTVFNKYETAICITHKCSIQNPNMMEDSKNVIILNFFEKLVRNKMIKYLANMMTSSIFPLSTKRIAEEYMPRLMMDLAGDLEDKGRR